MAIISTLVLPFVLCGVAFLILCRGQSTFDSFLKGAREGVTHTLSLLPTLLALMVAVGMYRASGLCEMLVAWVSPFTERIGIPTELTSLVLLRPLSGGASMALGADLFAQYGVDSFVGRCASVLMGSSDTVFYIVSVYFGAVGIQKGRHTVPVALLGMLFSVVFSCALVRIFFGT